MKLDTTNQYILYRRGGGGWQPGTGWQVDGGVGGAGNGDVVA
jgi:hypothetical protein